MKISFLSKSLVATWMCALEWAFAGMHSEVIKEIVPLAEVKLAAFEVTFKDFYASVSSRVLIFVYSIATCRRHFNFLDLNFVHVQ